MLEAKRKRVDLTHSEVDYGPVRMQTDGPMNNMNEISNGLTDPKNLQGAGSGLQTRREL